MKNKYPISLWIAGISIAGLPLIHSVFTLDPVLMPRFTLLAVAIMGMTVSLLWGKEKSNLSFAFLRSSKALPFYGFLITGFLALPAAINKAEAIFTMSRDIMFLLWMLLLIEAIAGKEDHLLLVVRCFVISAFIMAGVGIFQLLQLQLKATTGPVDYYLIRSTMAHRNLLVSILVLLIPFQVFTAWFYQRFWRFFSILVLLMSTILIIVLQSRTGWLALAACLLSIPIIKAFAHSRLVVFKFSWPGLSVLIIVILMVGFAFFYSSFQPLAPNAELREGLGFTEQNDRTFTADERIFMWKASGRMIRDQSLLGVGPGNWKIWFAKYGSDIWRSRQGMVQFQRPHNDYIWVLAEQGIGGLIAYILMGAAALFCGFSLIKQNRVSSSSKILVQLLLAGILAYGVISVFSFPRERIMHQLVLYSSFAVIFTMYFSSLKFEGKKWNVSFILALIFCPLFLIVGYQRWKGEVQSAKILVARAGGQWPIVLAEYKPIANYYFYTLDPTSVPLPFYEGVAHLSLKQYKLAQGDFKRAYLLHPYNIHVINNLANTYQLSGDSEMAIKYYEKALEISPKYLEGALNLIAAYFNSNQVDEAYKILMKYHHLFLADGKGDPRYQQYLLVVLRTMGDNLSDKRAGTEVAQKLKALTDEDLLQAHHHSLVNNIALDKALLDEAMEKENMDSLKL